MVQGDAGREPGQERAAAKELLGDDIGDHRRKDHGEQRLDRELAQDQLQPEEHAGDRRVERRRDPAARAAGDQDPQPVLRHPHDLAQARCQRGADLHDRPLTPDRPAGTDAQRRSDRFDRADLRPDPATVVGDRNHHLGHTVPAGLTRVTVDQRPVHQPAHDRYHHEKPQPQPRQMRAAHATLLAERDMAGSQPGEEVDQVPEHHRAQPRTRTDQQRQGEQPTAGTPQPGASPGGPRHLQPAGRICGHGRPFRAGRDRLAPRAHGGRLICRAGGPLAVRDLPRCCGKRPQRLGHRPLPPGREPGQDFRDQRPPARGRLVYHLPARGRDRHQHRTAVRPRPVPPDQPLAHQPVTHPARRGRGDAERRCQIHQSLRAPRRQHHQRPVLRDRGLLGGRAQRPGGDRDQSPARRQHPVNRALVHRVHGSTPSRSIVAYNNNSI